MASDLDEVPKNVKDMKKYTILGDFNDFLIFGA